MDRFELRRLDYSLSDHHVDLQNAYKQFFKTHCSIETVRAAEPSGFDKNLWERLCAMGATTMALPESTSPWWPKRSAGRWRRFRGSTMCAPRGCWGAWEHWAPTPPAWRTENSSRHSMRGSTVHGVRA